MTWSRIRRLPAAIVAVVVCATGASAQGRAQQVVPLELVQVLVIGYPYGPDTAGPRVLVGGMPEATASAVPIPVAARIVGSFVFGQMTRSALALAAEPDSVRGMMERSLIAAGWEKFRPPHQQSGFSMRIGDLLQFCMGDTTTLNLDVRAKPDGGSYLIITHSTDRDHSICSMERQPYPERRQSVIPALVAPAGAQQTSSGMGGGSDSWDAHTRVRTSAGADELLAHYDAQLRAAGWQPLATVADTGLIVRTYRVIDDDGAAWNAIFTVSAPAADGDRFLSVLALRAEPTR